MKSRILPHVKLVSGKRLKQWTNSSSKDQHLYFTSPSVTDDGKFLIIISDRDGHPNLYALNRFDESVVKISNSKGLLRSYTYPEGGEMGLSKASPYLDAKRGIVYWIQDDSVWKYRIDEDRNPSKVSNLPSGWITGYTHVSDDGLFFCVPCADPRAFDRKDDKNQHDQLKNVPQRMLENKINTKLIIVNLKTGDSFVHSQIPFWVTHVQFLKGSNRSMIVNCEGGLGNKAKRTYPFWGRIWKIDQNGRYEKLFSQSEGQSINHENLICVTGDVLYHGKDILPLFKKLTLYIMLLINMIMRGLLNKFTIENLFNHFVEIRNLNGELIERCNIDHPISHAISGSNKHQFLVDSSDGFIYEYNLKNGNCFQRVICQHGSSMSIQDSHPHPKLTGDGKSIIFTSDYGGACNVYEVEID